MVVHSWFWSTFIMMDMDCLSKRVTAESRPKNQLVCSCLDLEGYNSCHRIGRICQDFLTSLPPLSPRPPLNCSSKEHRGSRTWELHTCLPQGNAAWDNICWADREPTLFALPVTTWKGGRPFFQCLMEVDRFHRPTMGPVSKTEEKHLIEASMTQWQLRAVSDEKYKTSKVTDNLVFHYICFS